MPASERPDPEGASGPETEIAALRRLESAVERLIEELGATRERADRTEASYRKLRAALEATERDAGEAEDLQERIERLAEENGRLREIVAGARERAVRIRSRLMVVEDEL